MPDRVIPIVPAEQPQLFRGILPPFPSLVDNTMRGDFIQCPRKWMYSFLHSLAPAAPNVHLHAGGAFAKGLEVARRSFYEHGTTEAEALRAGLEALMVFYGPVEFPPTRSGDKSLDNVIKAFDSYMRRYRLGIDPLHPHVGADGKPMIEFNFSIITEVTNPTCSHCGYLTNPVTAVACVKCSGTLDPILFGGRCDLIGEMHKVLYVTDEKTASQLGDTWAAQWDLESQFTGYCAAAREYGYPVAGAVVRGIGLLKTKISHAEAIISRAPWQIERWWVQLHRDLRRMVAAYLEGYFDYALSKNACAAYGGCGFKLMCQSPEPERWLNQYRTRVWNPLAKDFGENLLENPLLKEGPNEELSIDLDDLK